MSEEERFAVEKQAEELMRMLGMEKKKEKAPTSAAVGGARAEGQGAAGAAAGAGEGKEEGERERQQRLSREGRNRKLVEAMTRKRKLFGHVGVVTMRTRRNNIHVNLSTLDGRTVCKLSGGMMPGMVHRQRGTVLVAEDMGKLLAQIAKDKGMTLPVIVQIDGINPAREFLVRGLIVGGMDVRRFDDITPQAHGGGRLPGRRRV